MYAFILRVRDQLLSFHTESNPILASELYFKSQLNNVMICTEWAVVPFTKAG